MVNNMNNLKEEIILKLKPHRLSFFIYYFLAFFILILNLYFQGIKYNSFFIPFLIIFFIELYRMALNYFFYNDKVVKVFKFVIVNETVIYYEKIQDIYLTQNILERIFNLGKIHINTAGSSNIELVLEGVEKPKEVKEEIDSLINNFLSYKNV